MKLEAKYCWMIIIGFLKSCDKADELEGAVDIINKHFGFEDGT